MLSDLAGRTAVLLNNDVRLAPNAIDPLVAPFETPSSAADANCFLTAPRCWRFDGTTYEGLKTAVRWRWGLVQATALYAGHEAAIHLPGFTATAGAAMAVDRLKFLELGGFDPLYFPGRLEDLDLAFRAHQAGYHARYVPQSVAFHLGCATFEREFGRQGSDQLALRNTLLFQWKNLRAPRHVVRQALGLAIRLAVDVWRAPRLPTSIRWSVWRALFEACRRVPELHRHHPSGPRSLAAECDFFRDFHPRNIDRLAGLTISIGHRADTPAQQMPAWPRDRLKQMAGSNGPQPVGLDHGTGGRRRWN